VQDTICDQTSAAWKGLATAATSEYRSLMITRIGKSVLVGERLTVSGLGAALGGGEAVPIWPPPADGLKRKLMEQLAPWARLEPQAGEVKVTLMVRCATAEALAAVVRQAKSPLAKMPEMFARECARMSARGLAYL